MWFVYVIKCMDGSLYTGFTNDLKERFKKHKSGRGAKYTRSHIPEKIVFSKKFKSKIVALKMEREIKGLTHSKKLEFIKRKDKPG